MISSISDYSNAVAYPLATARTFSPAQSIDNKNKESVNKDQQSHYLESIPGKSSDSELTLSDEAKKLSREDGFSEEELKKIEELKKRDQEVKTHEQAHQSAAGSLSNGGASFDYESGPDGKRYAVGGEVSIDTSKVADDPQATIAKARQIRSAALAPASPSGQDRQVAAQAVKMEAEANKELAAERQEQSVGGFTGFNTAKTDFYQQIQSTSNNQNSYSGSNSSGISRLDYYA